jgi:DNA transformation protein and related proteins
LHNLGLPPTVSILHNTNYAETPGMNDIKGDRLYVNLSATQTKRRLKGHGFGVRKIHSNGRNRAVVIHTATGRHRDELHALLADVIASEKSN